MRRRGRLLGIAIALVLGNLGLAKAAEASEAPIGRLSLALLAVISLAVLVSVVIGQERALRRRQAAELEARRFAAILGNALEGIARVDSEGIYAEVNRAYAETLGYAPEELIGQSCRDSVEAEDRGVFENFVEHARTRGKVQVEIRRRHRHGHTLNLMLTILPFEVTPGNASGFYCFQKNLTPERRALRALREATALRQAIFDSANFAMIAITADGDVRTINAGVTRMLGYNQQDLIGQPFLETILLADEVRANRDRVSMLTGSINTGDFSAFSVQARAGQVDERNWTYRRKDGTQVPVRLSLTPLNTNSGEVLGFLSIAQDLTAEQRYRDESRKLAALTQASHDFIATFGLDGGLSFVNESGKLLLGISSERLRSSNALDYLSPDFRELVLREVLPTLRTRESWQGEAQLRHCVTGEAIDMEASVFVVREPGSGKPMCYGTVMRDIRERKKQQEVVQNQALILDQVHDAVTTIDREARITSWNGGAERIFGYPTLEVLGRPIQFLLPETRRRWSPRRLFDRVEEEGEVHSEVEVVRKDGVRICVHNSYTIQRSTEGEVVGIITASQDVTRRKQAEAAMRRLVAELTEAKASAESASRVKSEFLAMMSHEIRTPLNGIIGMSQVLNGMAMNADQAEAAEIIQNSGEILLALINDVLDFSKVEAGRLELEHEQFDVHALVRETLALAEPLLRNKDLQLVSTLGVDVPRCLIGDRMRLRQLILNLVGNAIKFSERGEVRVAVSCLQDDEDGRQHLRFDVIDPGVGLSPEQTSRLFQPFTQADASTTRRFGGTGLGLAICRRLAELMGGEIGVESKLGEGSRFWFTIRAPLAGAVAVKPPNAVTDSACDLCRLHARILLAEDNTVNQRVACRLLEKLGCVVETVANGNEAVVAVADRSYDMVLMDLLMPGMDGLEATRLIRSRESGARRLPIIALTANAFADDRERCLSSGMDDFLAKPLRKSELEDTLRRWVAPVAAGPDRSG